MQLSEHFSLAEATYSATAIRLGIDNMPSTLQLQNMKVAANHLEFVRSLLGFPMHVDSWIRLPAVNIAVGGAAVSAHMDGWAIDFLCPEFGNPLAVCKAIVTAGIKFDQIIHEYGEWTHISFAPAMRGQMLTIFHPHKEYVSGLLTAEEYAARF